MGMSYLKKKYHVHRETKNGMQNVEFTHCRIWYIGTAWNNRDDSISL